LDLAALTTLVRVFQWLVGGTVPEAEEVSNFLLGRLSADAFDVDGVRHVGCFVCVCVIEVVWWSFVLLQWEDL
jgi:hypothetical protein